MSDLYSQLVLTAVPTLIVMLRRGFSVRPNLTAIIGGLACASAAATLLNFIHPYDAAATDLAAHAFAVAIVIVANTLCGGPLMRRYIYPRPATSNVVSASI